MKELFRSAMLGFMFGMLYFSGMPLELLLILGAIVLFFMVFKKKITPPINNFYNESSILSKIPIKFRSILTFIIILIIFMVLKQIIYFCLSYFFGININVEEYLNTTEIN